MTTQKLPPFTSPLFPMLCIIAPYLFFHFAVNIQSANAASLFLTVVLLWFTEALPLPVTGMLVPVLAVAGGTLEAPEAFSAFGNQILFLFIGSFLLARSMQKHGWDKRMAFWVLSSRLGGGSLHRLTLLIAALCWILSMWVSNTAACAMMAPLCLGIISTLRPSFSNEQDWNNFSTRLLLTCAFASSVGGMATPIGSPPNLLAIQFLSQQGIEVGFLEWTSIALPLSVVMLAVVHGILGLLFHTPNVSLSSVRSHFQEELNALGSVSSAEGATAACFFLAVILWILPDFVGQVISPEFGELCSSRLPMGGVAILASALLFIIHYRTASGERKPCLQWEDAREIDWGTVLLFGGGLCLGAALSSSGLAAQIGGTLLPSTSSNPLLVFAGVVFLGVALSEFSSNTASASILIPIILATPIGAGESTSLSLVLGTALGASFGFMLPVSTPPNAIVFGTGKVRLREMMRAGILFDVLGGLLIIFYLRVVETLFWLF